MRKTLKHDSTHAIVMIVFCKNRKSPIFKVLGVVVYCLIESFVCVDYLCLQRESKLLFLHQGFEDTLFGDLFWTFIPEIVLNIMSYYGYIQDNNSTLILECRRKLVSYHLSKTFVVIEKIIKPWRMCPKHSKITLILSICIIVIL